MTPQPPTPPDPTPPESGRRGRARWLIVSALVLLMIGFGLVGALVLRGTRPPEPVAEVAEAKHAPEMPPPEPLPLVRRIDTAILVGQYAEALALCKSTPPPSEESFSEWADREGLCLEGLGRWDEAIEAYQRAIPPPSTATVRTRAELGMVRCRAIMGDLTGAQDLLSQLVLRSADPEVAFPLLADCLMLRAWLRVLALGPTDNPAPLVPDAVEWPSLRPTINRCFEWQLTPRKSVRAAPSQGLTTQKTGLDRSDFDVSVQLAEASLVELLRRIPAEAGLFVRIDPAAVTRLQSHRANVQVVDCPFAELLSAMTESHGVAWNIAGDILTISLAPTRERAEQLEAAERSLRTAARVAWAHPVFTAVRIAQANLAWQSNRMREACDEYRRILDADPHAADSAAAAYNLGLAELRLGHPGSARKAFLECVDRFGSADDTQLAWWWVGYSHLQADELDQAMAALRTALAGPSREVTSAATLTLCLCHHLIGEETEAADLLRSQRISSRSRHVLLDGLFEALHLYQVRPTAGRAKALVRNLDQATQERLLGTAGVLLAGQVYARLGLMDKMASLYRAEEAMAKGSMAIRMTFAIAEHDYEQDRHAAARERYQAIAARDHQRLGARAEFRLAELAIRDGHAAECVTRCRALVGRRGVEVADLLTLMGRGYELQRKHLHAAECFAGRVPAE